jgi:ribonuclease P protein component
VTKRLNLSPAKPQPQLAERLTRRGQFLNVAKGKRCRFPGFTLQSAPRVPPASMQDSRSDTAAAGLDPKAVAVAPHAPSSSRSPPRFGITVTKKIGGAVTRNRIRRRLKEALRGLAPLPARLGYDYVFVARREALGIPFPVLKESLAKALVRIDGESAKPNPPKSSMDDAPRRDPAAQNSQRRQKAKDRTGEAPRT